MKKTFVLDTNVLLHNANCIESFEDNTVVLPMAVIEELDKFKKGSDEMSRNARQVIRSLDALRGKGKLGEGVPMENGGILKIISGKSDLPKEVLEIDIPDNMIIRVAYDLFKAGEKVIFVSKDINARLKADALGLQAMDFEKQKINFDELYSGYRQELVPKEVIDEFHKNRGFNLEEHDLFPNEFILLVDEANEKHTALALVKEDGLLLPLSANSESAWNIRPRNREQRMALELLLDDSVSIVTLVGQAGTGKTLLALAAGLQKVARQNKYEKILVSRPIMPMGRDIGYLPGSKEEKLVSWMEPIFDNLAYIMSQSKEADKKRTVLDRVDKLIKDRIIELEALTYIRGRSIPEQYIIVDEAQNLTPHEVKTIVSRAGEGSKMILTGDPYQIDNPYLDSSSNGLTYAVERLKEQPIHGHVSLRKSERSKLAGIAAELL